MTVKQLLRLFAARLGYAPPVFHVGDHSPAPAPAPIPVIALSTAGHSPGGPVHERWLNQECERVFDYGDSAWPDLRLSEPAEPIDHDRRRREQSIIDGCRWGNPYTDFFARHRGADLTNVISLECIRYEMRQAQRGPKGVA